MKRFAYGAEDSIRASLCIRQVRSVYRSFVTDEQWRDKHRVHESPPRTSCVHESRATGNQQTTM